MLTEAERGGAAEHSLEDASVPLLAEAEGVHHQSSETLEANHPNPSWRCSWRGPVGPALVLLVFQLCVLLGGVGLALAYLWRSLELQESGEPPYGPPGAYETTQTLAQQEEGRVWLVETLPLGGAEELWPIEGALSTVDALVALVQASTHSLLVTAMYWTLVPDNSTGAAMGPDRLKELGADRGSVLLGALSEAAQRGVHIQVLEDNSTTSLGGIQELTALQQAYPQQVTIARWDGGAWYGGGIMHMKLWVGDGRHVYLGSANMDWRSLAQVKEMGLLVMGCEALGRDVGALLESWFAWASLDPTGLVTSGYVEQWQATLNMPCWSSLLPTQQRCHSPLSPVLRALYAQWPPSSVSAPLSVRLNGSTVDVAVSGSPLDIVHLYPPLPQQPPARSSELEALLMTIRRAQMWVGVCVMDFSPSSLYTPPPLWWPQLADALLGAALTRNVSVRLLVSRWQHTSGVMLQYLRSLQLAASNTPLHIKVRQALP